MGAMCTVYSTDCIDSAFISLVCMQLIAVVHNNNETEMVMRMERRKAWV